MPYKWGRREYIRMILWCSLEKRTNLFEHLQDFSQQPPVQELIARDLHDNEWKFRHIFRGMYLNYGRRCRDGYA